MECKQLWLIPLRSKFRINHLLKNFLLNMCAAMSLYNYNIIFQNWSYEWYSIVNMYMCLAIFHSILPTGKWLQGTTPTSVIPRTDYWGWQCLSQTAIDQRACIFSSICLFTDPAITIKVLIGELKPYPNKAILTYYSTASASHLLVLFLVSLCSAWNRKQVLSIAVPCQPLKILQGLL